MLEAIQSTIDEMRISRDGYVLDGEPLSQSFVVRFSGDTNLAAARAAKFLQLQRVGRTWKEVSARDASDVMQRVYVDGDKNLRQSRTEMATKRLHSALKQCHPQLQFFARRQIGEVCLDYMAIARVIVVDANVTKLEWNLALSDAKNIDKEKVASTMAAAERTRPEIQWGG